MTSIFEAKRRDLFQSYMARIQIRDKLLGGTPKDPHIIEGWLRSKAGVTDEIEVRQMMLTTLIELGAEVTPDMTYEQLVEASTRLAAVKQTNGFKRDENGLYIEDRTVKAMLREVVNINFAGERWGPTRKGPKNFTAERVFINPAHISLGKQEADGVEMQIVHVDGKDGPRSSISYSEYVVRPVLDFEVLVLKDSIEEENWIDIWLTAEEGGLGASRSQSYGRFDVLRWDRVNGKK